MTDDDVKQFLAEAVAASPKRETWHIERYLRSWVWVRSVLRPDSLILDAGGGGPMVDLLLHLGYQVEITGPHDLRYPLPFDNGGYDLILCMEVIEHLKDQDRPDNRDTFDGSGIACCLSELRRVCKPGGRMFLSTPNVCCFRTIQRVLRGEHPFMFAPHHRELAPHDVLKYLREAGWATPRHEILSVWKDHSVSPNEKQAIDALAKRLYRNSSQLWGDSFFVLAEA